MTCKISVFYLKRMIRAQSVALLEMPIKIVVTALLLLKSEQSGKKRLNPLLQELDFTLQYGILKSE